MLGIVFWLLLFLGRGKLGVKGILVAVAIWSALVAGALSQSAPPLVFIIGQLLLDVVLILVVLGGDVHVR